MIWGSTRDTFAGSGGTQATDCQPESIGDDHAVPGHDSRNGYG